MSETTSGGGWTASVKKFMELANQGTNVRLDDATDQQKALRWKLIDEELAELHEAYHYGLEPESLHELADLIYVLVGVAVLHGWPLEDAFRAVCEANLSKFDESGNPYEVDASGKVKKGPEYKNPAPVIKELLRVRMP